MSEKERAIAVILSGTGSDGALGVQAIAEGGGIVFAQEPASAKFDGMPRGAIATGCVDFVLAPHAIASELARIAAEPRLIPRRGPQPKDEFAGSEKDFQTVLDMLRAGTGIDFGLYRQATVRRRLLRRLALLRLSNLDAYVEHLKENPDELHALTQDILIRVTHFFRDPEVFEVLGRRVFPGLIRKAPVDGGIRIWVSGCSTGEEAYSIGICFLEVAAQMQSRVPVQIFATDINEAAIEKARRGIYINNIAADVSPERLGRFFVRNGKEYQVSRRVREVCVFSRHDLLNDPPFSRMNLISCRNVLIYLDSMQKEAFSRFHFALNPGGFLLLGKAETAASSPGLFAPLDREARLYARQESSQNSVSANPDRKELTFPFSSSATPDVRQPRGIDLRRQADLLLIERYGPPRLIVNGNLEPVAFGGETAALLNSHRGIGPRTILELVPKAGADALKDAVQKARKTSQSIRIEQFKLGEGANLPEVSVEVTALGADRQHFLIAFEQRQPEPSESVETTDRGERREAGIRISRLEKELASNRARLESIIVEQEAANEEVVAANEELQSLNEELESSKEELEATNEELSTVNQELQVRNTELEGAREFAQATIDTVRGSLLVLGPDLRVLKANRTFFRTFRLAPAEVEHRFIHEVGDGLFGMTRLRKLLEEVLPENRAMEDFEVENADSVRGRRTLVLNARGFESERRILLAIEDVTEVRKAEVGLRQSQKMEAIGYLAAGVAHDFNNLLTGVIGNASLLMESLPEYGIGKSLLRSVISGGERAAELTRQLLAYAGKGRFYMERVQLSEIVIQTGTLIHASIPVNVQLRLDLDKDLPLLLADPGQIQQVVMNLVINAAEAIGEAGGSVLVKTGRQTVTNDSLPDLYLDGKLAPGEYIFLEVNDNGSGMDEQTIRKIFDPFFTTKFSGRGLGLAAVQGIVRQHKGAIQIHSVPGRGSSFRVLFSVAEYVPPQIAEDAIAEDLRGFGTVLVVDDEVVIRNFTKSALEPFGYKVLLAQHGAEALRIFQENPGGVGLVLLDLAMPEMDGVETLKRMRAIRPDVPAVVCSAFGDVEVENRFEGLEVAAVFPKPYTVKQLAKKVKECISGSGVSQ
jgi:two-component system CheB/CheR fusion protein